ncbi:hypothetical protein BDW66DRAFT_126607 [Aspergillus desertorum]
MLVVTLFSPVCLIAGRTCRQLPGCVCPRHPRRLGSDRLILRRRGMPLKEALGLGEGVDGGQVDECSHRSSIVRGALCERPRDRQRLGSDRPRVLSVRLPCWTGIKCAPSQPLSAVVWLLFWPACCAGEQKDRADHTPSLCQRRSRGQLRSRRGL